jgi:hypothetical protein
MNQLSIRNPTLKVLYLTPEMLNKSSQMQLILLDLHKRKKLSSVVDKAHGISLSS